MANYIETASTKPILSRVSYVGEYAQDVYGYVEGYLNNLEINYLQNEIKVSSGLIAVDGKRIVINDEMNISLAYESGGGMMEYNLFLKVNMATPDVLTLVTSSIYANPSGYRNDDLFLNYENGIKFIKLATIINSNSGIQGIEKVIPDIKEEYNYLQETVKQVEEEFMFDTGWIELDVDGYYYKNGTVKTQIRRVGKTVFLNFRATSKLEIPITKLGNVFNAIPSQFRPESAVVSFAVGVQTSQAILNSDLIINSDGVVTLRCPTSKVTPDILFAGYVTWLVD